MKIVGRLFVQLRTLAVRAERAAYAFKYYLASAARISGHFTLSLEAKSASRSRVPMSCDSERAAYAFKYYLASVARISGHFTLSLEAKSASRSRVPMSCDSERAAYAFKYNLRFFD